MTDKKNEKKNDGTCCKSCGDSRVMLSEEKNSPPKCAGCGKSVAPPAKSN